MLAFYSYRAFATYVRSCMESGPVTYGTFFSIFLGNEASLYSTAGMVRDFARRRSLRSKAAMVLMPLSMLYVLAWPTFASAMTGYTTASAAFVTDRQGNLISYDTFLPVAYVIRDGWRVNLTGNYLVTYKQREFWSSCEWSFSLNGLDVERLT